MNGARKATGMTTDKTDIWFPFYPGDYLRDTMHLSTVQHGAYMLLIMHYWMVGGPISAELDGVYSACKADRYTWPKIKPLLTEFFELRDGKYHHKRLDEEIAKAKELKEKQRARTAAATEARKAKQAERAQRNVSVTSPRNDDTSRRNVTNIGTSSPSPSHKEKNIKKRKSTIPDGFPDQPTIELLQANHPTVDVRTQAERFRNSALANNRKYVDWTAAFRNWITSPYQKPRDPPKTGSFDLEAFDRAQGDWD